MIHETEKNCFFFDLVKIFVHNDRIKTNGKLGQMLNKERPVARPLEVQRH